MWRWVILLGSVGCTSRASRRAVRSVEGGEYRFTEPADFSGTALIFFHGYNGSAAGVQGRSWMEALEPQRVLGIFPEGIDKTWAHVGSPSDARDELAFLDAVVADVRANWSIERLYVSGFSQGASMAWDAACYRGATFDAAFPVAGAFWEPLPEACGTPLPLRHTHGTADTTYPLTGRPIGSWQQGDVNAGLTVWRERNRCREETQDVTEGSATCTVWQCETAREVRLCLHDGAHQVPGEWLEQNLSWANEL